jgi:prepilin-type N-terminal cleavage/methylation domain-containing protein
MKKKGKRAMTLLELMIVILIIGIIGSVVGYNIRGTLEKGKAFKTEQAALKLYDILLIHQAEGHDLKTVINKKMDEKGGVTDVVKSSGLVRSSKDIAKDGWGEDFIEFNLDGGKLSFKSKKYDDYCEATGKTAKYPWSDEDAS